MGQDDRFADGQAQTAATGASIDPIPPPMNALEDALPLAQRDAGSCVAHMQNESVGPAAIRWTHPEGQRDRAAAGGVAECVVEQVAEHLSQPHLIAHHQQRLRGQVGRQGDGAPGRHRLEGPDGGATHLVDLYEFVLQR